MKILKLNTNELIVNKITYFVLLFYFLTIIFGKNATAQISDRNNNSKDNTIFFQELFEDTDFSSRGWYDNTNLYLSNIEHIPGSNSSVEFHFLPGATTPTSGTAIRHLFTGTEEIYVSYWVKYSSNWEGSNMPYHPHEFLILSNENGIWDGPAYTHLTAYIEQNEGEPLLSIQDGQNIDESNIGVDLTGVTEDRAVAGCNGDSDGYGNGECYLAGSLHRNGKQWRAGAVYFQDSLGIYYKNDWHFIEAYFKLNSIAGGIGVADGTIKYWYDGNLIVNYNDIMMRTGIHPNMKFNQFMIAPWIGDGSPVDQTMWVDNLTVADYIVISGITHDELANSDNLLLQQNYPNPFNSTTKISYYVPNSNIVTLKIYDLFGNVVQTLINKYQSQNKYSVTVNSKNITSGIYYYKLRIGNKTVGTKKMIVIR